MQKSLIDEILSFPYIMYIHIFETACVCKFTISKLYIAPFVLFLLIINDLYNSISLMCDAREIPNRFRTHSLIFPFLLSSFHCRRTRRSLLGTSSID